MRSTPNTRRRDLAPMPRVFWISMTPTAPVSDITGNSVVTISSTRVSMILPVVRHSSQVGRSRARGSVARSTGRVGGGRRRVRQQGGPRQPALLALVTNQPVHGHTPGREEVAHRVRQADIERVAVAQPGQRSKVIN